ncbi:hypothetical protein J1614_000888 [Plenodomus biglobosus]|nr:hypothetical protein J1614_000888 [Plenodomus biglobosus]
MMSVMCKVPPFLSLNLECRFQVSDFRVQSSEFRVQDAQADGRRDSQGSVTSALAASGNVSGIADVISNTTRRGFISRHGIATTQATHEAAHLQLIVSASLITLHMPTTMLRRALFLPRFPTQPRPRIRNQRYASSTPSTSPTASSRIARVNRRLPRFLHKYTVALSNAPLTHITSFLILHELSAIIPLFSLAAYFHYTHWLPPWFAEGAWVASGVERFGRYFRRKGWIRGEEEVEARREVEKHNEAVKDADADEAKGGGLRRIDKAWNVSEGGVRLVVEFATAYAITKMFLVPRIMFSVWATPWFARWTVVPVLGRVRRLFGGKKTSKWGNGTAGAGTGAVEGGAVPKVGSGKK